MKFVLFGFIALYSFYASAQQQLIWFAYDQPPAYIFYGEQKGKGYINLAHAQLAQLMPQYQHVQQQMTVGRLLNDLKHTDACAFGLFRNSERETYLYFSKPALLHRNLYVMMRTSLVNSLALGQSVQLDTLLGTHNLSLNVIDGRSYGKYIDRVLSKFPMNIRQRPSQATKNLFKMLDRERFDMMLVYPGAARYALSQLDLKHDYSLLKIKGIAPFTHSAIACHKSEFGKGVIKAVDIALEQLSKDYAYFDALSFWDKEMPDNNEFRAYYKKVFMNQAERELN